MMTKQEREAILEESRAGVLVIVLAVVEGHLHPQLLGTN